MLKVRHNIDCWSFGICTDGKRLIYHDEIVNAIRSLNIPNYEIIFCTENNEFFRSDCKVIYIGKKKPAWITKKKNKIAKQAIYSNLFLLHDYAKPGGNWFKGFEEFGNDWDVCCTPVLKPDGERWWDWAQIKPHELLPYDVKDKTHNMYVSGTSFAVNKEFFCKYPLNEELTWNEDEDGEWAKRVNSFWKLKFNPKSPVHLLRYPRT
jgi:hypothetical protein